MRDVGIGGLPGRAAEDDEDTATAHAAFIDSWLPATAPAGPRQDMLSKLAAARQMLKDGGISWLGLMSLASPASRGEDTATVRSTIPA